MGWNFAVGKGGAYAALIACWFAGLLYTCVAMIDSEVTSTVAAAGGQYTQAKHIVGPLMAFNVGLYLVFAYTMLEAADAKHLRLIVDRKPALRRVIRGSGRDAAAPARRTPVGCGNSWTRCETVSGSLKR